MVGQPPFAVIMITIGMIDIRYWRLLSAPAYLVSFVLLVAVTFLLFRRLPGSFLPVEDPALFAALVDLWMFDSRAWWQGAERDDHGAPAHDARSNDNTGRF